MQAVFYRWRVVAALALLCLFGLGAAARASVAVLLEQPYGNLGRVSPMGHTALYFDHICADSPVSLRPCNPGELGVVISRYDGIGHYDWIAVPLLPYLYAVETPEEIPLIVTRDSVAALRDGYRRRHLEDVAPDLPNGAAPDGNWYELAGSAFDRTLYGFRVKTTPEQDEHLIALFNDRRNVERYNGAFRNCADFVRVTINRLYPHAIRRNFVADLGVTTPKSVARGLAHYARKHPNMGLEYFVIPQVPGLRRSFGVEGVSEGLIKRYGVPLIVLSPVATAVVFVAYLGHGRFEMPHDPPVLDLRQQATAIASEQTETQTGGTPSHPGEGASPAAEPEEAPSPLWQHSAPALAAPLEDKATPTENNLRLPVLLVDAPASH